MSSRSSKTERPYLLPERMAHVRTTQSLQGRTGRQHGVVQVCLMAFGWPLLLHLDSPFSRCIRFFLTVSRASNGIFIAHNHTNAQKNSTHCPSTADSPNDWTTSSTQTTPHKPSTLIPWAPQRQSIESPVSRVSAPCGCGPHLCGFVPMTPPEAVCLCMASNCHGSCQGPLSLISHLPCQKSTA
jgi:hypothetical protein